MKRIALPFTFLSFLCFSEAWAQDITQNQTLDNAIASMFQYLELDSVSTGFLLDRAVEAVDISRFNGTLTNDNYVDLMSFRNTLITLNSAVVNSVASEIDGNYITNSLVEPGVVNLGAAAYKYNYIASNALSNNLISYQNDRLYDVYVNGLWRNPYVEAYTFVFTPGSPIIQGPNVTYQFSSSQLFTNLSISSIEFDNGNGTYQTIGSSYEETVVYSTSGNKHLRMKLTLDNNTILESHAWITVLGNASGPMNTPWPNYSNTFYATSGGKQISAFVSGRSCHNGSAVIEPFIYVEGFDDKVLSLVQDISPSIDSNKISISVAALFSVVMGSYHGEYSFHDLYNNPFASSITNHYDVFYVDFNNPEADIRDNAILLEEAIEWINGLKVDNAERNTVMGHSMGGLVARYALCEMEGQEILHETDCFVSFDSPHMGVNIPLGLQYAFRDIYSALYGDSSSSGLVTLDGYDPITSYLMSLYSSPAAKQMMYYYIEPDGSLNTDYHDNWQEILDGIGFPQGDLGHSIENLSIVNGGAYQTSNNNLLNMGLSIGNDPLFSSGWLRWLLAIISHATNLEMSIQAYRNGGNGGTVATAQGTYKKKFGWLSSPKQINLFAQNTRVHSSPPSSVAFDYIKSSIISVDSLIVQQGNDYLRFSLRDSIPFVPMASALAFSDYSMAAPPTPQKETPFGAYCVNSQTISHTSSNGVFSWVYNQANCTLTGPRGVVESGDDFSVNAPADYNNPTWTSSEPSSFSLSNNILTFTGNSSPTRAIRIRYNNSGNGSYMSKRRTLLTGFPEIIANVQHVSGNSYEVTASCTYAHSHLQPVVDSLAADGSIKYVWGRKTNSGDIDWADTTNTRSHICAALQGDMTYIYVKMYCRPGCVSDLPAMVEIDRRTNIPFFYDPKETIVGQYFGIPNYTQIQPFPMNGHLVLWHNSDYNGTPVAPDNIKIGNTVIPLASSYSASIDGETKTVYCFDFMDCSGAQAAEAWAREAYLAGDPIVSLLRIYIRNGTTDLYYIDYPFIPAEN